MGDAVEPRPPFVGLIVGLLLVLAAINVPA